MPSTIPLVSPVTRKPLEWVNGKLVSHDEQRTFSVVDGIPILLPHAGDCDRAEEIASATGGESEACPLSYYNRPSLQKEYYKDRGDLAHWHRVLGDWIARAQATGPTLEIGSGEGKLQGSGTDYVALDYSLTALRNHIDPKYQRICSSAEFLPFLNNTFGLVFSFDTLEHVPNPDRSFDELARVLKPGGVAVIKPAWHCVQNRCDGVSMRPYRELSVRQKLVKLSLPIISRPAFKAAVKLPRRMARRLLWSATDRSAIPLRFNRLTPDYKTRWGSDSDATAHLDSHEGCLYFHSRGYTVLNPGAGALHQLAAGHIVLVVRKPLCHSETLSGSRTAVSGIYE